MSLPPPPERASQALEDEKGNSSQTRRPPAQQARPRDHRLEGDVRGRSDGDEASHRDGQRGKAPQRVFVADAGEVRELPGPVDQRPQHSTLPANRRHPRVAESLEQHVHVVPVRPAAGVLQEGSPEAKQLHLQRKDLPRQLPHPKPARRQSVRREPQERASNVLRDARQVVRLLLPVQLEQSQIPEHVVSRASVLWVEPVCLGTRAGLGRRQLFGRHQCVESRIRRARHRRRSATVPEHAWQRSNQRIHGVTNEAAKVQRHTSEEAAKAVEGRAVADHHRLQPLVDQLGHAEAAAGQLVPQVKKHKQHALPEPDPPPTRRHRDRAIDRQPLRQQLVVAELARQLSADEVCGRRRGCDLVRR